MTWPTRYDIGTRHAQDASAELSGIRCKDRGCLDSPPSLVSPPSMDIPPDETSIDLHGFLADF